MKFLGFVSEVRMPLAFFADNPFHMETIFDDRSADKKSQPKVR